MVTQSAVVLAVAVVVATVAHPAESTAQSKTASISGRVLGPADQGPVAGARVTMINPRKVIATDSVGRFAFLALAAGSYRIEANLIGFPPLTAVVTVADAERKEIEFRTDSLGQLLPTIEVVGAPEPVTLRALSTFERRMSTGHGRFITREDIVRRNPSRILDMIRFLPGVQIDCRASTCSIRLNRDRSGCPPAIFVDEQPTNISVLDYTAPNDVEGIEVYRGPAETPPALNNETARCGGAIALWTRRGARS